MYSNCYRLFIYKTSTRFKEELETPFGHRLELPLFGLANALLQVPLPVLDFNTEIDFGNGLQVFANNVGLNTLTLVEMNEVAGGSIEGAQNSTPDFILNIANHAWKSNFERMLAGGFEEPVALKALFKDPIPNWAAYILEIIAIEEGLKRWLEPVGKGRAGKYDRKTPKQRYAELWLLGNSPLDTEVLFSMTAKTIMGALKSPENIAQAQRIFCLLEARRERASQFSTDIVAVSDRSKACPAELFSSEKGLIPLIWAEIMYAVRNDIFARYCEICGNWFPITKGFVKQPVKKKDSKIAGSMHRSGYQTFWQKYCSEKCQAEGDRILRLKKKLKIKRECAKNDEEKEEYAKNSGDKIKQDRNQITNN